YGSSQYLNLYKSIDGGASFYGIVTNAAMNSEASAFNGPFEIAPSDPNIMYAGAQSLWRSEDGGESWISASKGFLADADVILTIAIDPQNPDIVYCSTAPTTTGIARVFKFDYSLGTKIELQGLPDRLCMDIAISPNNSQTLFATFSGFNSQHVWRSLDGGQSWQASDNGLPDVPSNTLLIEPALPDYVYVGNDLGVWLSTDNGTSWTLYSATAAQSMLVMHLSFSADHLLRVATHGLGLWQTQAATPSATREAGQGVEIQSIYPNPTVDLVTVQFHLPQAEKLNCRVVDAGGKTVLAWASERLPAGAHTKLLHLGLLPAGNYGLILETDRGRVGRLVVKN
ncbi:MAG: T9SS type A sorting domain-containing protein, partial [Saprospiraceae bacterium]